MRRHIATYWIFQMVGWGLYCLGYIFFYLTILTWREPYFYQQLTVHAITGLALTHLMRSVIQRLGVLEYTFKKQVIVMLLLSLCFSFLIGITAVTTENLLGIQDEKSMQHSFLNLVVRFTISYYQFILLWNLIYFVYHYIQKARQQKIDQARLESLLKELEIRTIKAHINPHFIFNSLNSIRALVVEDPERARSAITQLSNILRNSMQGDKAEKSLFEKELSVARDYLALEQIRFESRLRVSYDIEEDTLDQPVPAMVLQALIENALTYGVSNEVNGGSIEICSHFNNSHHIFGVKSTGNYEKYLAERSEGIAKLRNRLDLLYGNGAGFELKYTVAGFVDAEVSVPV